MRKLITSAWTKLAATAAVLFFAVSGHAQVATNYTFAQMSGTYTPITGGTVVATATVGGTGAASLDDVIYGPVTIPFNFTYNGTVYTQLRISSNGFITFGATAPGTTNYVPVSSANAYSGAVAAFGRDMQGNVVAGNLGEIRYEALGSTPTQTFVIQYGNFRRFGATGEDIEFQIRLEETTNVISVVYNTPTIGTGSSATNPQVGLRGATNADYNNRTSTTTWSATTAGTANTNTITFNATTFVTGGQTYVWTPVAPCAGTPTAGSISGATAVCSGTGTTLTLSGHTVAPGITLQWQSSTTPGGPYTNMGTSTTQATGNISVTMYYVVVVTCANGGATATTSEFTVNILAPPTISVSPTTSAMCFGDPAIALTASGSSVSYAWGPAAGLSSTTGTSVNASPGGTTTYTVTGTDGSGCTATATTTVTVDRMPTFTSVTATPAFICVGGNSQLNALATVPSIIITEVTLFRTGTGATPSYPAYITGQDLVEISNISSSPVDISGYTLNDYASNSATTSHPTFTFPAGTIIPANGVSVVCLGTGTDDVPNRYFNTGGASDSWSSSSAVGIVLKNGAVIVDAVGCASGYTFNAGTGVTAADWSGFAPSGSGLAGTIRTGAVDNNTGGNWSASSVLTPQSIGTYNPIYTVPPTISYSWSPSTYLSATNIANPMANAVASSITYTVTATGGACSTNSTVTVTAGAALSGTGSIAPSSTVCENTNVTLNVTPTGGGAPYAYSWTGPNTFTSNLQSPVISGVTVAAAGTYTVVISDACSNSFTVNVTLNVDPSPAISVSPTSATYCYPGTPVTLTASGTSVSYAWGPAAGLSATTGTSVDASPAATTTYTVTGTGSNGCTGSATTAITATEAPSMAPVTATPASVCAGGSSQLLTGGATTTSYVITPIAHAPVPVPGVGVTTLANGGVATTALSAGTLDDGGWYNQNIGFSFNFYGATYTQFSVSTNGFIVLGGGTPNTNTGYGNAFPSTFAGRPSIGAVYSDLDFRTIGTVNYYVTGVAPNRALVINWTGGNFYNATGAITTQAIIYETSNMIEVHTSNSTGTNSGVQGIQNAAGTAASTVAGRNANNFTVTVPDAYRWAPSGGAVTYMWAPPTFLSSTTVANPMANSVTATVTYTATVTNGGCSASGTVTVTAGSPLTSSGSISPASTVCEGTTVTLNSTPAGGGAPYTYAWSGPNSFASTLQNPTLVATVAAAGTYTVVITDNCAATSTVTLTLGVNAAPTLTVTPVSATYCSGAAGLSLTATGTSTSYTWGPAAGLSATTGSSVTATPSVTTTYTVTGTDGNGCTSTATSAITYAMTPVLTAVSTPTAICEGGNATLNGVGVFAPTYCQPTYSTGTGFGDYISSVVLNTLNNATGASASPYYTLYPASGNTTTTLVAGTTYTITLSPGTYTINDVAAWIDFNQNGTLNDASEKLGETDNMGAMPATTSFTFTVPLTAFNGPTRLRVRDMDHGGTNDMDPCAAQSQWGETEDYVVTITGGVDAVSFAWSPSTYLSSTTGASVNAVAAMSTTTYTVTGTSAAGCTATGSATLTVNPNPTVTAVLSPDTVCAGDMVTPTGGGATSYAWSGGLTDAVPFAAMSTNTYTVTGTDANGCTNTATASVTVNSLPVVTLSGNNTICAGDTTVLTGSSGGTSQWYLNGSPIAGATANTYAATTAGVYNMVKTNANGCADSSATGITVIVNALPAVTASSTASAVCAGDQVTLTGGGASTYVWTGGVTDNVAFTPVATDTYTVTGTDANGCSDTATATVTVNGLPSVTASLTPSPACVGDMVTPAGSGASTYVWTGGLTDGVAFAATTSDTYTVTGTDVNGCTGTTTVSITVNPLPVVTASATDSTVCVGDQITFMGGGASTYTWDNGVTDMVPYTVAASGTFIVTGTDANGCMDTASLAITANALPNVTVALPLDTACLLLGPVTLSGESPVGGTWSGPGVTGNSFNPGAAGNGMHAITYTYMDSVTGCSASAVDSMLVDICNGIDNNAVGNAVVYPNPNNGDFTLIPAGSGMVDVMIYSATGQLVIAEKVIAGQPNQIRLEASGMYSVVIVTAEGVRTTQRVVVNR